MMAQKPSSSIRDPIITLKEDHRLFLQIVQSFQTHLQSLPSHGGVPASVPQNVAEFAMFLRHDVNLIHGQQEERGLFPVLGRHLPVEGGPIGVMIGEHETLRDYQSRLERCGIRLADDPDAEDTKQELLATSYRIGEFLEAHVFKEDTILFPLAYQVLSPQELTEIGQIFDEVVTTTTDRLSDPSIPSPKRRVGVKWSAH